MARKRQQPYECFIEVEYIPFPSEEQRREAYYTHAKLFLKAKERHGNAYQRPKKMRYRQLFIICISIGRYTGDCNPLAGNV